MEPDNIDRQDAAALDVIDEDSRAWGSESLDAAVTEDDFYKTWATRLFWLSVAMLCGMVFVGVWDHVDRRTVVEAFVQAVKESADGQVILLQPAKPLREYVVEPASIHLWLSRLIVDLRRVSQDATVNQDARRNVQAAVCGPESQTIATPATRDAELIVVQADPPQPGPSPRTWHGQWEETWYDRMLAVKGTHLFRADFTLARRDLDWKQKDSMAIFARNPIALCLQRVTIYQVPGR